MKKAFILLLVVAISFGAAGYWLWQKVSNPLPMTIDSVEVKIASGSGIRAVGSALADAGIDLPDWVFLIVARVYHPEKTIKAGFYLINKGESLLDALDKFKDGKVVLSNVTIIEGWTFRQMRALIDAQPDLVHNTKDLSEQELIDRLGPAAKGLSSLEGMFFPDTYRFDKYSSDLALFQRAFQTMEQHLNEEWEHRQDNLPYKTPYEALIMASIIEKETGREEERGLVAAVFVNRLRRGMLLQTDPSVIYGLGDKFDGSIYKSDLLTDTPYNTYTRTGLTPTPIALPGLASIQAALHPEKSDALYFVSRNDGTSHFSRTLAEHNEAVNRYQRRKQTTRSK